VRVEVDVEDDDGDDDGEGDEHHREEILGRLEVGWEKWRARAQKRQYL